MASGSMPAFVTPSRAQCRATMAAMSGGMSSGRSTSGGSAIATTLSR